MVTPNRRRQAVVELEDVFGVSQRRACRVVGQPRATQRLVPPKPSSEEQQIREWLRAFAKRRPRWGWRRAAKGLRREGWQVNDKKVRRLWRDEGLRVPPETSQETPHRHRCPSRADVTFVPERVVGNGLPIRYHRQWTDPEAVERHRRVHPRSACDRHPSQHRR